MGQHLRQLESTPFQTPSNVSVILGKCKIEIVEEIKI